MSQHLFPSTHQGHPVQIMLGWDRPLQGFFMVIERTDASDDDDIVYSNLYDVDLLPNRGFASDVSYFQTKLAELDLQVPEGILQEVRTDRAYNVGNRVVMYDGAGNPLDSNG